MVFIIAIGTLTKTRVQSVVVGRHGGKKGVAVVVKSLRLLAHI